MTESWFETLDRAKALGREYAENGIAEGDTEPLEAPLSGEWAGAMSPRDIVTQLTGKDDTFDTLEGWEVDDLASHWEDGYNSAGWPNR